MHDAIGWRRIGCCEGWVPEADCVRDDDDLAFFLEEGVTAVVVEGWPDVKSFLAAVVPRSACRRLCVDERATAWRAHGCGIKVEWSIYVFPGGCSWGGLAKEVDCELSLGQEEVPAGGREGGVDAGQDSEEVCLKCADGAFGCVAAVHVWRD